MRGYFILMSNPANFISIIEENYEVIIRLLAKMQQNP
jgi:hypothetical protein